MFETKIVVAREKRSGQKVEEKVFFSHAESPLPIAEGTVLFLFVLFHYKSEKGREEAFILAISTSGITP